MFDLEIQKDDETYHLALFGDVNGVPEFFRCSIHNLQEESIPEGILPLLQTFQEHMLTSIRVSSKFDVRLADVPVVWAFSEQGKPAEIKLEITARTNDFYDPEHTKNIFSASFEIRELLRLYSDGIDLRIPIQYRYLSLYKLVENRFRKNAKWNKAELKEFLQPFEAIFSEYGFKEPPAKVMHNIRDKCAHINTGKQELGVTHLNHKQLTQVEKLMPIMRSICATVVNQRATGKLEIGTAIYHDGLLAPSQEKSP